jgi:hypothetical protein
LGNGSDDAGVPTADDSGPAAETPDRHDDAGVPGDEVSGAVTETPERRDDAGAPAAPTSAPATGPLLHPDGPGAFRWRLGVGLMLDVLPARVVDSSAREYPRLALQFRYGLPRGFSADIKLNAVVISNELQVGGAWSFAAGPVSIAIRNHVALWYGRIGRSGFDTTGWGIMTFPGLSVGTAARGSWFALTGEMILVHVQYVSFGRAHVEHIDTHRDGFILTLSVETPVGRGLIVYGVAAIRADPEYQMWLAFSDSPYKQIYPRFFVSYAF